MTTATQTYAKPIVRLNILKPKYGDCSNYGMSHYFDEVDLYPADTEVWDLDPAKADKAVKIVYRDYLGYAHVEPVESPEANAIGWMAGGTYVAAIDSRFSDAVEKATGHRHFHGALAFHDRQETQAQYNALSR